MHNIFRVLLVLIWGIVVYFTVIPTLSEGILAANDVFGHDVSQFNWRSQFNVDLLAHMTLVGSWVAWRNRFSPTGIVLGLLCLFGGSLFSYMYVLIISFANQGDVRKILLGKQGEVAAI